MCLFFKNIHFISDLQSSSSSSSESDDAPSLRSEKLGLMKFDESACPEGCEQDLYDLTFVLRCQRWAACINYKEHKYIKFVTCDPTCITTVHPSYLRAAGSCQMMSDFSWNPFFNIWAVSYWTLSTVKDVRWQRAAFISRTIPSFGRCLHARAGYIHKYLILIKHN